MPYLTDFRNPNFEGRYLPYSKIQNYLKKLPALFNLKKEGFSVQNRPIFSITLGTGPIKVLAWSQMHGDESTSTKALLDFMEGIPKQDETLQKFCRELTLKIIPVLNPDGAVAYTRTNANGVDLNRDALDLSQPESQLLQRIGKEFNPDFAFNMHDQDPVYGIGETSKAAILSFLAPGIDREGTIGTARKRALQTIVGICRAIEEDIPGHVGRYKDEFNPNCMGEYFQLQGVSTILFESGHIQQDYRRERVRKYVFNAFVIALKDIIKQAYKHYSTVDYFSIPRNKESFYDVIIREVIKSGKLVDIALQYREKLQDGHIQWIPEIKKIGGLKNYFGHREIQGYHREINGIPKEGCAITDIMNEITLNNEKISIILTNN